MYIGSRLDCSAITLPVEISRCTFGRRICAPSMPLALVPSTMLSRVAPHEACFGDLHVGQAVLGEDALFLGDDQRRGVGERDVAELRALVTSGPAAACANAPAGKAAFTADISAAVAAVADACFIRSRRLMPAWPADVDPLAVVLLIVVIAPSLFGRERRRCSGASFAAMRIAKQKSRSPRHARVASSSGQRRCFWGPALDRWRRRWRPSRIRVITRFVPTRRSA